jgi:hypothetical protein
MIKQTILMTALLGAFATPAQAATSKPNATQSVRIDTSQLDAAHGWEMVTAGVYQRIDPIDGTISTVSVGEAGRNHDYMVAKADLALLQQQRRNALDRNQSTKELNAQIAELEQTIFRLTPEPKSLNKGSVTVYDGTEFCHLVAGTFEATFSKQPRVGGGVTGSVITKVGSRQCYPTVDFCAPGDDVTTGYKGGTRALSQATNSAGTVSQLLYSNGGYSADMYTFPSAQTAATTYNVGDSACSLRAGGYINTTLTTNSYGTCYLYRNFNVIKTCAQVP